LAKRLSSRFGMACVAICSYLKGKRMQLRISSAVLVGVTLASLVVVSAGCGGGETVQELNRQQQLRDAKRLGGLQARLDQAERQLRELKRENQRLRRGSEGPKAPTGGTPTTPDPPDPPAPPAAASCGDGVSNGPNTTCGFARNVATAYYESGGGSVTVTAFSPTTHETYSMACSAGAPTVCRGGNDATVYIH
jgi:hypothetical protein